MRSSEIPLSRGCFLGRGAGTLGFEREVRAVDLDRDPEVFALVGAALREDSLAFELGLAVFFEVFVVLRAIKDHELASFSQLIIGLVHIYSGKLPEK